MRQGLLALTEGESLEDSHCEDSGRKQDVGSEEDAIGADAEGDQQEFLQEAGDYHGSPTLSQCPGVSDAKRVQLEVDEVEMLEDLEVRKGSITEMIPQQPDEPTYVHSSSPPDYIPSTHRSPQIAESPPSDHSPNRFDLSPTISPPVRLRGTSTTPRNTHIRSRISASITPTASLSRGLASTLLTAHPVNVGQPDDADEGGIIDLCDEDWGDDAVLQWDGVDLTADSASSVAPEDAGLDSDDLEEEEGEWGREAIMGFDWDGEVLETGSESEEEEPVEYRPEPKARPDTEETEEEEEEIEEVEERPERNTHSDRSDQASFSAKGMVVETPADLQARGMPDYSTWELKRLQVSHLSHALVYWSNPANLFSGCAKDSGIDPAQIILLSKKSL